MVLLPGSVNQVAGEVDVKVSLGSNESEVISFSYDSNGVHNLVSVSPISASPVQKGVLTLTGVGFGVDKSKVQVFLEREVDGKREVVYELFVQSVVDT